MKKYKTKPSDPSAILPMPSQIEAMAQLFENLRDVVFSVKGLGGRYICANKAFLLRAGLQTKSEIIGKTTRELFPLALAIEFEKQDDEIFNGKEGIYNRLDVVTNSDRSLGWYITDKVPVRDTRRKVIAIASTTRDLKIPANDRASEMSQIVDFVTTMQRRFSEPIRIGVLAEKSGVSLSKLERKMRSIMSISPRQLLTRIRVEAAIDLLTTTDKRLSEIAYECGFCDQPTFCRQFKNLTGMTAREYRKLKRDQPVPA